MNCKRARKQIALSVGGDLDPGSRKQLKDHLADCIGCRALWRQMKQSIGLLHEPAATPAARDADSVWPAVARRLPRRARAMRKERFNGWAAGLSVALACSVLVVYAVTYESPASLRPLASEPFQVQPAKGFPRNDRDRPLPEGALPGGTFESFIPLRDDEQQPATPRKDRSTRSKIDELFDVK